MSIAGFDISTNELVIAHNIACGKLIASYEGSIRHAEQMIEMLKDGRKRAKYRRQITRYSRAIVELRKALI